MLNPSVYSKKYYISILIRTRDKETYLCTLLDCISKQSLQPEELVIVDNFSTKNQLEKMINLMKKAKRKMFNNDIEIVIVPISDKEFSYSYTANAGISIAKGKLICITNAHCLPTSTNWLESGCFHFRDEEVVGVAGYTRPHSDGTIWEKIAFDWVWRRLNETSKSYRKDNFFSTTNCILRRRMWMEYPFEENIKERIPNAKEFGGEDYDWALEMLARGYRLVVEPKFNVYHSHKETISPLLKKYFTWLQIRRKIRSLPRPRESHTKVLNENPIQIEVP